MNSFEWLEKLVSFDTTSRNANLDMIQFIENFLARVGWHCRLTFNEEQTKANLFATLAAKNGEQQGGMVLSGHSDVVPVDGQAWETDPFVATQHANRIYGRGCTDMKGFIAVVLALVPEFKRAQLSYPLHLAISFDEEVGCNGAPLLIADLAKENIKPRVCIVGEPTNMHCVIAHKGIQVFRCEVIGRAAHSSLTPSGCNAINYAARLIIFLEALAQQLAQGEKDSHFDVPFTTLSTNVIAGGNAYNTIPGACEFFFEFRQLPHVNPDEIHQAIQKYIADSLLPTMREDFPEAVIKVEKIASAPSFAANDASEFVGLIRKLLQENAILKVAYGTEAGLFQAAGMDTIVCGPGDIAQAHRANEFVEIAQLKKCEEFLKSLVAAYTD